VCVWSLSEDWSLDPKVSRKTRVQQMLGADRVGLGQLFSTYMKQLKLQEVYNLTCWIYVKIKLRILHVHVFVKIPKIRRSSGIRKK